MKVILCKQLNFEQGLSNCITLPKQFEIKKVVHWDDCITIYYECALNAEHSESYVCRLLPCGVPYSELKLQHIATVVPPFMDVAFNLMRVL